MSRIGRAFKATFVIHSFDALATVISFIAVPLYLAYLGAERYGLILTAQTWTSFLSLSGGGISWATMILVSHASGRGDEAELSRVVRAGFVLSLGGAAVACLLSLGGYSLLQVPRFASALKLDHPEAGGLLLMVGAQVAITFIFSSAYELLAGLQEGHRSGFFNGVSRLGGQLGSVVVAWRGGTLLEVAGAGVAIQTVVGAVCALHVLGRYPWLRYETGAVTREQLALQLRTGLKGMGMSIGTTLYSTAPVWAISIIAGPQFVPLFALPHRLLTLASGILWSFAASMQAAFGEAFGRGDLAWVRHSASQLLEKTLVLSAGLFAVIVACGPGFIELWTAGRLQSSTGLFLSAACAAGTWVFLSAMRFVLTGINRHKKAAVAEIINGALAMLFCWAAVRFLGVDWAGVGVLLAGLGSSMRLLPRELKANLGGGPVLPTHPRFVRILVMTLGAWAVPGLLLQQFWTGATLTRWSVLVASGVTGLLVCVGLAVATGMLDGNWLAQKLRLRRA